MGRAKKKNGTFAEAVGAAAAAAVEAKTAGASLQWSTDDPEDEEQILQTQEILDDLEKIDDDAGGEVVWELYCDLPLDKKGQIRKLARSELRGLRDECLSLGPGKYHVVARGRNGAFAVGSRRNIEISGFARPATPAAPAFDPAALMMMMEERAQRRENERRNERNAQLRFWAPILAPIAAEMVKGLFGGRGGESIKDLVGALASMQQLTGGNGSDKTIDALFKGIELAKDMAPAGGEKGSTWPDIVLSALREVRPIAESLRRPALAGPAAPAPAGLQYQLPGTTTAGEQPAPVSSAPAAGAAAGPSQNASQNGPSAEDQEMWRMVEPLLRRLAQDLEDFASNAAEASLAAEALLAKVPRFIRAQVQTAQLKGWLEQPDWWRVLVQFHPALQPYQAFCDDVRLSLLAILEDEANPPADTGSET